MTSAVTRFLLGSVGAARWLRLGCVGVFGGLIGFAAAAPAAPPPSPPSPASPSSPASGAKSSELDFASVLSEMRAAVAQVATLQKGADKAGDKIKEACLYERLRGMAQAVDSAQVAQVAWEGAVARSDQPAARTEQARVQKALDLLRQLRGESDTCVGKELLTIAGSSPTKVTVEYHGPTDDPLAGPAELWAVKPVRLELPSRPNPASAFRASR